MCHDGIMRCVTTTSNKGHAIIVYNLPAKIVSKWRDCHARRSISFIRLSILIKQMFCFVLPCLLKQSFTKRTYKAFVTVCFVSPFVVLSIGLISYQ